MNETRKLIYLMVLAVGFGGPSVGFAGKCAGNSINNLVSWEPTEISTGTTLAIMRITSVFVSDDPSAAYHLLSGECIGSFLITPDGKMQGSGSCARRYKEGDVLNEEWITTDGAGAKGTWKNVGGTGKFAKTASTGQWESTKLQGKMSAVRWVGNCQ